MRYFGKACILLLFWLVSIKPVHSAVYIFDDVAALKEPIQLMVLTKGRLFPAGGKLIDVYLDGDHLGRIMSGGDGYGFIKYIPQNVGMHKVRVVSEGSEDAGMVLVPGQKLKTLCVEVETGLGRSFFGPKSKVGMAAVLMELRQRYTLIYLSRFFGPINARKTLHKAGCPRAVTIRWLGAETFDELRRKGLRLDAVIASAEVLSEAVDYVENRFAFEETEDGTMVENWEALARALK